jgi:serine/threonine protein kinase
MEAFVSCKAIPRATLTIMYYLNAPKMGRSLDMPGIKSRLQSKAHSDSQSFKLDLMTVLKVSISIVKAMAFIHRKKIMHRDLKTDNILVDDLQKASIKIYEFGLATSDTQTTPGRHELLLPDIP